MGEYCNCAENIPISKFLLVFLADECQAYSSRLHQLSPSVFHRIAPTSIYAPAAITVKNNPSKPRQTAAWNVFIFNHSVHASCVRVSSQRPLLRNEAFQVPHPGVPFISFVDSFRGSSDGNSNKTTFPGSPRPTGPGPFPRKWIYIQLKFWALGVKVMLDYLRLFSVQQTPPAHKLHTRTHTVECNGIFYLFFKDTNSITETNADTVNKKWWPRRWFNPLRHLRRARERRGALLTLIASSDEQQ